MLDLFCGAGGASTGYAEAGFDVAGIDVAPQPNYPFDFVKADAMLLSDSIFEAFDVIHASPPCQRYNALAKQKGSHRKYPDLIAPLRDRLVETGKPYVIENIPGSPLIRPIRLCGTMFEGLRVIRHRHFESNMALPQPKCRKHPRVHAYDKRRAKYGQTDQWRDFVGVYGSGDACLAAARDAMGIDWMERHELNEAIPPPYTKFIGSEILRLL